MLIKSKTFILIVGALFVVGIAGAAFAQSDAPVVYTNKDLAAFGSEKPAKADKAEDATDDAADAEPEAAEAADAKPAATPAAVQVQPGPAGAFTNDDLARLASGDVTELPEVGERTNPPAGTSRPAAPDAAEIDASVAWLDELSRKVQLDAAIAEAERRVRDAASKLDGFSNGLRPKGSAFESGSVTTEDLYSYDVVDQGSKRDAMLANLQRDLADARAELARLTAQR